MQSVAISVAIATLALGTLAACTSSKTLETVPVLLRPDTDHGSCSIGLQVNEGGAVLRTGPGTEYAAIATLESGHVVSGCDARDGWEGVIDGLDETCSVGIEVDTTRSYDGPCPSGWIEQKFLTSIYG